MKIAVLFPSPNIGGSELGGLEIIMALQGAGHDFIAFLPYEGPMRGRLESVGVSVFVIPYDWWSTEHESLSIFKYFRRILGFFSSAIKIAKIVKRNNCEAVYTNTVVIPVGAIAAKFLKLPHFWYLHEFGFEDHGFSFLASKGTIRRFISRFSKFVIVNSHAMYNVYRKYVSSQKMFVAYLPVQMPNFDIRNLPLGPNGELRVILTGRIAKAKGQEDAIRAIGLCRQKGLNITLTLLGYQSDDYTNYLKKLVEELGLVDFVTFASFNPNPQDFIREHHVALVCSRFEAFGRVTIEAQKMGLPVIAANTGGSLELIDDGKTGLLYTPTNHAELADKIELLYNSSELREKIATEAQQFALRVCNADAHATIFDKMVNA